MALPVNFFQTTEGKDKKLIILKKLEEDTKWSHKPR